jgi:hypothetical protein
MILNMWVKVSENGGRKSVKNYRLKWSIDPEKSQYRVVVLNDPHSAVPHCQTRYFQHNKTLSDLPP